MSRPARQFALSRFRHPDMGALLDHEPSVGNLCGQPTTLCGRRVGIVGHHEHAGRDLDRTQL